MMKNNPISILESLDMKKIISLLALVCLICCMFPISAFASSDIEYIQNGQHTGIWYSNPATKEALDKCVIYVDSKQSRVTADLNHETIDIYDDLLLANSYLYDFRFGTIRCHNCRAFNLYEDNIKLYLSDMCIEGGRAICPDDNDYGYGGAIYVDGAGCKIVDTRQQVKALMLYLRDPENASVITHSYIEDCYADEYGGAIAVCGHDCTIESLTFRSNTGYNNGGNDLYVYWGDCHLSRHVLFPFFRHPDPPKSMSKRIFLFPCILLHTIIVFAIVIFAQKSTIFAQIFISAL